MSGLVVIFASDVSDEDLLGCVFVTNWDTLLILQAINSSASPRSTNMIRSLGGGPGTNVDGRRYGMMELGISLWMS